MSGKRLTILLVGLAAMGLLLLGSLVASLRIVSIGTPSGFNRVFLGVRRLPDELAQDLITRAPLPELPEMPRLVTRLDEAMEPGTVVINGGHSLASISRLLWDGAAMMFRVLGISLLALGVILLLGQRYQIVRREPPPKKG